MVRQSRIATPVEAAVDARKLLLCALSGFLLRPAPPLRGSDASPRIGAKYALLSRLVTKGSGADAGAARADQEGTDFLEATDFFIYCSN
jgi:hypothetical protein